MKKVKLIFGIIALFFSFILIYNQYNKNLVFKNGKEIIIEKGNFSVPLSCEYTHKHSSKYIKFIYKGKEHSIKVKKKKCIEIKKIEELKLITNERENVFVLKNLI